MIKWEFKFLSTDDPKISIRYGIAKNPDVEPDRYVVFINGRTEWIEKYDFLPAKLGLPENCGYLSWDHRGQGASGGPRAYVHSYDNYVADAERVISAAVGNKPYVIVAHSMGGLISIYGVLQQKLKPRAMVFSGPLLGMPQNPMSTTFSRPISRMLTSLNLGVVSSGTGKHHRLPFKRNRLTHSREIFNKIRNSPYRLPGATFGWIKSTFEAIDRIFDPALLKTLTVPILILAGSEEQVVDSAAFSRWVLAANQVSKATIQLAVINGGKHELYAESPPYIDAAIAQTRQWYGFFMK